jgi:hypothetical protein
MIIGLVFFIFLISRRTPPLDAGELAHTEGCPDRGRRRSGLQGTLFLHFIEQPDVSPGEYFFLDVLQRYLPFYVPEHVLGFFP